MKFSKRKNCFALEDQGSKREHPGKGLGKRWTLRCVCLENCMCP